MQGSCSCAIPAVVGHHYGCTSTTAWLPDGNQRSGCVQLVISFMTLWWYNKIWTILVQVATERVTVGLFIYFVVGYLLWSLLLHEPSFTFSTCCLLSQKKKNYLFTYLLTPRCRVLLQKLTGLPLVKKLPAFRGTRRFITALTSVRHLSLSWASPYTHIPPPGDPS